MARAGKRVWLALAVVVAIAVILVLVFARCDDDATCAPGQVLENGTCRDVAASLHGLRWEMQCKTSHPIDFCDALVEKPTKTATLAGDTARLYDVTLHFRGVVEWEAYADGKAEEPWYIGGRPNDGLYNIYQLSTSAPAQVFYLNASSGNVRLSRVWTLDYQKTIRVQGGATVTLSADAQDHRLVINTDDKGKPLIIPGVPPAPAPFDGQFIQMDVVSVVPAPAH